MVHASAPVPDPGPDEEEPDRSPLPPAAEGDGPAEQGLYLCLPPEQLTLAGFAQNGEADTMAPGPLLATIVDTVIGPDGHGLTGCSDDQLLGIISAGRRMEARAAWTVTAAGPSLAALVTITIPLATYQGRSETPGEADGFGVLDGRAHGSRLATFDQAMAKLHHDVAELVPDSQQPNVSPGACMA